MSTSRQTERVVRRAVKITTQRPQAPREVQFATSTNLLTWTAPANTSAVTHYRIRVGSDLKTGPLYEVPVAQNVLQLTPGVTTVYISGYNQTSGLESVRVPATIAPTFPGISGSGATPSGPVTALAVAPIMRDPQGGRIQLGFTYVAPVADLTFQGVHIWEEIPAQTTTRPVTDVSQADIATASENFTPIDCYKQPGGTGSYQAIIWVDMPAQDTRARFYAPSYNADIDPPPVAADQAHPSPYAEIVLGPGGTASVGGTTGSDGATKYTQNVSGAGVYVDGAHILTSPAQAGIRVNRVGIAENYWELRYTPPSDSRFGGVNFRVVDASAPGGFRLLAHAAATAKSEPFIYTAPMTPQTIKVYLVAYDSGGNENTIVDGLTPYVLINVGTVAGTVNAGQLFNFYSAEFKFDGSGRFAIHGLDFSKAMAGTFTNQFSLGGGGTQFTLVAVDGALIVSGILQVGGGGSKPSIFKVFDHSGLLVGWIGDDFTGSGYDGAWFKRVMIGGSAPSATPPFFADASGNVVMRAMFVYDAGVPLGWVGSNGGFSGAWFLKVGIGSITGSDISTCPLYADASGNLRITNAVFTASNGTSTVTVSKDAINSLDSGVSVSDSTAFTTVGSRGWEIWKGASGSGTGVCSASLAGAFLNGANLNLTDTTGATQIDLLVTTGSGHLSLTGGIVLLLDPGQTTLTAGGGIVQYYKVNIGGTIYKLALYPV